MLDVRGIETYYGSSHILFDVSLAVNKGEVVGLLGRNGAGKSTTMRSIMGLTPPRKGRISFHGEDITGCKPFQVFRRGIGYVPDDRRVFADLSVDDNLEIVFGSKTEWSKERVYGIFPALAEIKARRAGNLSGGEQQMLTIARGLMGGPELLLLDEPTEGLAPAHRSRPGGADSDAQGCRDQHPPVGTERKIGPEDDQQGIRDR